MFVTDAELADFDLAPSTVEGRVPFVAQISSGQACADGRYVFPDVEFSAAELPFAVVLDLAGLEACGEVPVLIDHDVKRPVGVAERVWVERNRLLAAGHLDGRLEHGARAIRDHRHGITWRVSIAPAHTSATTGPLSQATSASSSGRKPSAKEASCRYPSGIGNNSPAAESIWK
jgi:hypothetical protein